MNRYQIGAVVKMLAVGCAIIILASLLVEGMARVRDAAARTQTVNNLKQTSLSLHSFNDVYKRLPPATGWMGPAETIKPKLARIGTVFIHIIPYMESSTVYKDILQSDGDILHTDPPLLPFFLCPNDPTLGREKGASNFAANLRAFTTAGINSKFDAAINSNKWGFPFGEAKIPDTFADGTSNTIAFTTIYSVCQPGTVTTFFTSAKESPSPFFGMDAPRLPASPENQAGQIFQLRPDPVDCNTRWTPQAFSRRGILVGLFDGSVAQIRPDITPEIWAKLQHPADGDKNVTPSD